MGQWVRVLAVETREPEFGSAATMLKAGHGYGTAPVTPLLWIGQVGGERQEDCLVATNLAEKLQRSGSQRDLVSRNEVYREIRWPLHVHAWV